MIRLRTTLVLASIPSLILSYFFTFFLPLSIAAHRRSSAASTDVSLLRRSANRAGVLRVFVWCLYCVCVCFFCACDTYLAEESDNETSVAVRVRHNAFRPFFGTCPPGVCVCVSVKVFADFACCFRVCWCDFERRFLVRTRWTLPSSNRSQTSTQPRGAISLNSSGFSSRPAADYTSHNEGN